MSSRNVWTITLPEGVKLRRGMEIESVDFIAKTASVGEGPDHRGSFRRQWLTVDAMPDHKILVTDRAAANYDEDKCYLQTFRDPDPGEGVWVVAGRTR